MYCCTQGRGHINKCPVSFSHHNLFPFKKLGRDGALCQPCLQLKWRSMLPFGDLRQWDLQALFSFLVSLWVSGTCVCFVLLSLLFFFSVLLLFWIHGPSWPHPQQNIKLYVNLGTKDMWSGWAYLIKLKVFCSMQNKTVERDLSCMHCASHFHSLQWAASEISRSGTH